MAESPPTGAESAKLRLQRKLDHLKVIKQALPELEVLFKSYVDKGSEVFRFPEDRFVTQKFWRFISLDDRKIIGEFLQKKLGVTLEDIGNGKVEKKTFDAFLKNLRTFQKDSGVLFRLKDEIKRLKKEKSDLERGMSKERIDRILELQEGKVFSKFTLVEEGNLEKLRIRVKRLRREGKNEVADREERYLKEREIAQHKRKGEEFEEASNFSEISASELQSLKSLRIRITGLEEEIKQKEEVHRQEQHDISLEQSLGFLFGGSFFDFMKEFSTFPIVDEHDELIDIDQRSQVCIRAISEFMLQRTKILGELGGDENNLRRDFIEFSKRVADLVSTIRGTASYLYKVEFRQVQEKFKQGVDVDPAVSEGLEQSIDTALRDFYLKAKSCPDEDLRNKMLELVPKEVIEQEKKQVKELHVHARETENGRRHSEPVLPIPKEQEPEGKRQLKTPPARGEKGARGRMISFFQGVTAAAEKTFLKPKTPKSSKSKPGSPNSGTSSGGGE